MKFGGAYVLSRDPLVFALQDHDLARQLTETPIDRPATLVWHDDFYVNKTSRLRRVVKLMRKFEKAGYSPLHMTNSGPEDRYRRLMGWRGGRGSIYVYSNEHLYHAADGENRFDAIYIAQLARFKRFELASRVKRLFVMTYEGNGTGEWDLHEQFPQVRHAEFNRRWVSADEKLKLMHDSQCGLALSKHEGAMIGSLEYLLCGLPVVSVPSDGGRAEFYDRYNSHIVARHPDSVARGVEHMVSRSDAPSRQEIRDRAIVRLHQERQRYIERIDQALRIAGLNWDADGVLQTLNRAADSQYLPSVEFLQLIRSD